MFYEIASIRIHPGSEAAFEARVAEAEPLFRRAKGCVSMALHKMVEEPARYHLMVGWETVEDHTVDFRQSEDFKQWRALVGEFFVTPPEVAHWEAKHTFFS